MLKIGSGLITFLIVLYGYLIGYNLDVPYFILLFLIGFMSLLSLRYVIGVMGGMSRNHLLAYFALVLLVVSVTVVADSPYLMFALYLAVAYLGEGSGLRMLIRHFFIASVIMFALTIILYLAGVLEDNTIYRTVEDVVYTRLSLGFHNPNSPMLYALPILASGAYLFFNRVKRLKYYLFAIGFIVLLYAVTNSRTGLYTGLLFVLSTLLPIWAVKFVTIRGILVRYLFPLLAMGSVILALFFGAGTSVNDALSNRPGFWMQYISSSGVMPSFGGVGVMEGVLVDNMYIYMLYGTGVISFTVFLWIFVYGTRIALRSPDWKIFMSIIALYLVYGMFETSIMMTSINLAIPLLLFYIIGSWHDTRLLTDKGHKII